MNTNDIYCDEILNGKIRVEILKETENFLAFYHTNPMYTFHVIIAPKKHVLDLLSLDDFSKISEVFQIAVDIIKEKQLEGYMIRVGGGSFQHTKHLHFHLLAGLQLHT